MSVADKRVALPRMAALGHKQTISLVLAECPLSGAKQSFRGDYSGAES